jgi:hypothetical protein
MGSNNLLFIRSGELIVGQKVSGNKTIEPALGKKFKTRLSFKVEKDESGEANKSKIQIYNLSNDSRAFIERENMICFLKAGYEGSISTIFFGDIDNENGISTKRSGPDIITTIEAGDVEESLRTANVQIGLSAGALNTQAIKAATDALQVPIGYVGNIPSVKFQSGFSYSGSAKTLLNQLMKQVDLNWSIQDGEFQVMARKETDLVPAIKLNKDTGLINTPTKSKNDKIEFTSLLHPGLRPGRRAEIQSSFFNNGDPLIVKIGKVVIEGDTHEGKWQSFCEGVTIG